MSDIAVRVENVSKLYRIGLSRNDSLSEIFNSWIKRPLHRNGKENHGNREEYRGDKTLDFWALRDVSFDVNQGDVIGIIGRNGAGKSTLLKILSRITKPTTGRVEIHGRVGSLLEVGAGFHPELTGRENIYLSGTILGMKKSEIDRKFDEIVAFAEVEKFLDTPVKRYSSGMYVRLAFAVAAHLEPETLIVDEVLAVGDVEFQRKCFGKMTEVAKHGRTVLLVSHNVAAVLNLCRQAILLEGGRMIQFAKVDQVVSQYLATNRQYNAFSPAMGEELGDRRAKIEHFEIRPTQPQTGMPLEFVFTISNNSERERLLAELSVSVLTQDGARLFQLYSRHMGCEFELPRGRVQILARVESLPLSPRNYTVNLWLGIGNTPFHWLRGCFVLSVAPGCLKEGHFVDFDGYPILAPSSWQMRF